MFDTYIFDLYGTLVDIHTNEKSSELWSKMSLLYQYRGANYGPLELKEIFFQEVEHAFEEMDKRDKRVGKISKCEIQIEYVYQELFRKKGIEVGLTECISLAQFFRALSTEYIRLYQGAVELLRDLKEKNKKVYLLSNAQAAFTRGELELLEISSYFDGIALSSEIGYMKPDNRFYQYLIDKYEIASSKAIMIGNDYKADILGGRNVGLHTCYLHSNLSPKEDSDNISTIKADILLETMDLKKVKSLILQ